jgi:hypothetical protein
MLEFLAIFLIREVEEIVDVRGPSEVWSKSKEGKNAGERKKILEVVIWCFCRSFCSQMRRFWPRPSSLRGIP